MSAPALMSARQAIAAMIHEHPSIVLAVSGGLDSVCLLHLAVTSANAGSRLRIATFDHRSGPHTARAVAHVKSLARHYGVPLHVGRAADAGHSESEWRAMRWHFLRQVARRDDAVVATAHTRDDQLETVIMRILRGSGARGLAGLLSDSPGIVRPLVHVSRTTLTSCAQQNGLEWLDDPTNESRRFFRNRVRHDLLPALRKADPQLPDVLLALSKRAAELRREMEQLVAPWVHREGAHVVVRDDMLALPDETTRAAMWPAVLGPQDVVLDRRGITRLARLTWDSPRGLRVPLSTGWEATRTAAGVTFRRTKTSEPALEQTIPPRGRVQFGAWTFAVRAESSGKAPDDAWSAWLPAEVSVQVRSWKDGDRIAAGPHGSPRRVKRFFSDRRIAANERKGWPVVIAGGEIVWIPGIRRVPAVSARSGRPARLVVCERIHV